MDAKFDELIQNIRLEALHSSSPNQEVSKIVIERIQKIFENPPINELELVLQQNFNLARARAFLFFPDERMVDYYPQLIMSHSPEENSTLTHPAVIKVQATSLAMFYLLHLRNWKLTRCFILKGGLLALASLFRKGTNPYLKSQAIDSFMQITSGEHIDWFSTHKPGDQIIFYRMLELSQTTFIKDILTCYDSEFPGESFYCLQILGMWLSWVRLHYAKDNKLPVSRSILDELRRWSERNDVEIEESELATKIYTDFSRLPALDQNSDLISSLNVPNDAKTLDKVHALASDPQPLSNVIRAKSYKEEGNVLFTSGDYKGAIESYSEAINSDDSNAIYYSNRAACYLKLVPVIREGDVLYIAKEAQNNKECHHYLNQCIIDCNTAIDIDPTSAKAFYRRAQAQRLQCDLHSALDSVNLAVDASVATNSNSSRNSKKLLNLIKAELQLKDIKENGVSKASFDSQGELDVFSALISRYGIDESTICYSENSNYNNDTTNSNTNSSTESENYNIGRNNNKGSKKDRTITMNQSETQLSEKTLNAMKELNILQNDNNDKKIVESDFIIKTSSATTTVNKSLSGINRINKLIKRREKMVNQKKVNGKKKNRTVGFSGFGIMQSFNGRNDKEIDATPKNTFQLTRKWNSLNKDPLMFGSFLKTISLSQLQHILKDNIDSDIVTYIGRSVRACYLPQNHGGAIELLRMISQVNRFDMAIMLLSPCDTALVKEMFTELQSCEHNLDKEAFSELTLLYGI